MDGLQSGEGRMMIDSVIWAQHINVTPTHRYPRRQSTSCANRVCIGLHNFSPSTKTDNLNFMTRQLFSRVMFLSQDFVSVNFLVHCTQLWFVQLVNK